MWKLRYFSTVLVSQNWSRQSFKSKPGVDIVSVVDAFVVFVVIADEAFVATPTKDKKFINKILWKSLTTLSQVQHDPQQQYY